MEEPRGRVMTEEDRRETFNRSTWTKEYMSINEFVYNGFFFTGNSDIVKCINCHIEIGNWLRGDVISRIHRLFSPTCPIFGQFSSTDSERDSNTRENTHQQNIENIPPLRVIRYFHPQTQNSPTTPPAHTTPPASHGTPAAHNQTLDFLLNGYKSVLDHSHSFLHEFMYFIESTKKEYVHRLSNLQHELTEHSVDIIEPVIRPMYEEYRTLQSRLGSFNSWPLSMKPRGSKLSEAGFFYTGQSDETKCFSCGKLISNWLPGNKPWVEHVKASRKCSFVIQMKGREFIDSIVKTRVVSGGWFVHSSTGELANSKPSTSHKKRKKNKEKDESSPNLTCKVCLTNDIELVLLPCRHFATCATCCVSLLDCPICRAPFRATMRVFI